MQVFVCKYWMNKVDSDEMLICEMHKIAKNISEVFAGDLLTPKADEVLDSMCWDQNDNILCDFGCQRRASQNYNKF